MKSLTKIGFGGFENFVYVTIKVCFVMSQQSNNALFSERKEQKFGCCVYVFYIYDYVSFIDSFILLCLFMNWKDHHCYSELLFSFMTCMLLVFLFRHSF